MPKPIEHTGVIESVRWPINDSDFVIGSCEPTDTYPDGVRFCGNANPGEIILGVEYTFYGKWDHHPKFGPQFKFRQYLKRQPASSHGLIKYLEKHAHGIGPKRALKLWDEYGPDAVKMLRTDPHAAAFVMGVKFELTEIASNQLQALAEEEQTRIELTNLFAGRGFHGVLVDECIEKWGLLAPERVKRDPYCLLVEGLSGCGFNRCDRLYQDLGLNPSRLKRQVICLWHLIRSDSSGDTWIDAYAMKQRLGELIGGVQVRAGKAIQIGVRSGWLALHRDGDGKPWLAEGKSAKNETYLAERIVELMGSEEHVAQAV